MTWSVVLKRLALLAFGTCVGLLVAELGLRALGSAKGIDYRLYLEELHNPRRVPPGLFQWRPGRALNPVLRPGAKVVGHCIDYSQQYTVNSLGLRDDEHPYAREPGKTRVLALGDSFTFGEGVAQGARFADLPEQLVPDLEVVVAAAPGWGIDHSLLFYLEDGHKYAADAVVLFINQVDTARHETGTYRDGQLDLRLERDSPVQRHIPKDAPAGLVRKAEAGSVYLARDDAHYARIPLLAVTSKSYLLSYALYQIEIAQMRSKLGAAQLKKKGMGPHEELFDEASAEIRARTLVILRALAAQARARGSELWIVNIDQDYALAYLDELGPEVPYLNLSSSLHEAGKSRDLRFKYDSHYAPWTHGFIGSAVADFFSERLAKRVGSR